ncbi:MAG TPA: NADH-quinone oxidoreductase subunit C [Fimbriimonadaceae bacterium]|nr:NADH-quinone oxidoreductase subunit C [Fimbriimonadaceae bacterium]
MSVAERADVALLKEKFGGAIESVTDKNGDVYVCVATESLEEIAKFLKEDPRLAYNYYVECVGVDYLTWEHGRDFYKRYEVIHNLYSIDFNTRLFIKVACDDGETVPSLINVYMGAEYPEREIWDLLGVVFKGNEQKERFLLPDDWVGHPLRKDVGLGGEDVVFDSGTLGPAVEDVQSPHAGESFEGKTGSEDVSGR